MIDGNFAQLGDFTRKEETYTFEAFFHLNSEQILVGQEAHLLIRPQLRINGRKASASLMKNTKVKVVIEDFLDKSAPVERSYENLTFEDDKETIISF